MSRLDAGSRKASVKARKPSGGRSSASRVMRKRCPWRCETSQDIQADCIVISLGAGLASDATHLETRGGKARFGRGNPYAEPTPQVVLHPVSRRWHLGKLLFEKNWFRRWFQEPIDGSRTAVGSHSRACCDRVATSPSDAVAVASCGNGTPPESPVTRSRRA